MKSFDALGYLSTDVETERRALRERHQTEFARVETLAERAIAELKAIRGAASQSRMVSAAGTPGS